MELILYFGTHEPSGLKIFPGNIIILLHQDAIEYVTGLALLAWTDLHFQSSSMLRVRVRFVRVIHST